jgi:hypothetical protein
MTSSRAGGRPPQTLERWYSTSGQKLSRAAISGALAARRQTATSRLPLVLVSPDVWGRRDHGATLPTRDEPHVGRGRRGPAHDLAEGGCARRTRSRSEAAGRPPPQPQGRRLRQVRQRRLCVAREPTNSKRRPGRQFVRCARQRKAPSHGSTSGTVTTSAPGSLPMVMSSADQPQVSFGIRARRRRTMPNRYPCHHEHAHGRRFDVTASRPTLFHVRIGVFGPTVDGGAMPLSPRDRSLATLGVHPGEPSPPPAHHDALRVMARPLGLKNSQGASPAPQGARRGRSGRCPGLSARSRARVGGQPEVRGWSSARGSLWSERQTERRTC